VDVRPATAAETDEWNAGWVDRLRTWWGSVDGPVSWPDAQVAAKLTEFGRAAETRTSVMEQDGRKIGFMTLARYAQPSVMVTDLWIDPAVASAGSAASLGSVASGDSAASGSSDAVAGDGFAAAAIEWAKDWARPHVDSLWVSTNPADPRFAAFDGFDVRAQWMVKRLAPVEPMPAGVTGRSMTADEFAVWRGASVADYAEQIAASGALGADAAVRAAAEQFDQILPQGLATEKQTFWTIEADGTGVGTNWIAHGYADKLSFVYGVEVGEEHRGKGYGRAAMLVGEQAALDAGDTHLALNVFGFNAPAIHLYEKMRYITVEQRRAIRL